MASCACRRPHGVCGFVAPGGWVMACSTSARPTDLSCRLRLPTVIRVLVAVFGLVVVAGPEAHSQSPSGDYLNFQNQLRPGKPTNRAELKNPKTGQPQMLVQANE